MTHSGRRRHSASRKMNSRNFLGRVRETMPFSIPEFAGAVRKFPRAISRLPRAADLPRLFAELPRTFDLPHRRIERELVEKKRRQEIRNVKRKLARRLRREQRGFAIDKSIADSLERKLERLQNRTPTFEDHARHLIKRTACQLVVAFVLTVQLVGLAGYFDSPYIV